MKLWTRFGMIPNRKLNESEALHTLLNEMKKMKVSAQLDSNDFMNHTNKMRNHPHSSTTNGYTNGIEKSICNDEPICFGHCAWNRRDNQQQSRCGEFSPHRAYRVNGSNLLAITNDCRDKNANRSDMNLSPAKEEEENKGKQRELKPLQYHFGSFGKNGPNPSEFAMCVLLQTDENESESESERRRENIISFSLSLCQKRSQLLCWKQESFRWRRMSIQKTWEDR